MNHLFRMVDALASLARQYSTLNLDGSFYTLVAQYMYYFRLTPNKQYKLHRRTLHSSRSLIRAEFKMETFSGCGQPRISRWSPHRLNSNFRAFSAIPHKLCAACTTEALSVCSFYALSVSLSRSPSAYTYTCLRWSASAAFYFALALLRSGKKKNTVKRITISLNRIKPTASCVSSPPARMFASGSSPLLFFGGDFASRSVSPTVRNGRLRPPLPPFLASFRAESCVPRG